MLGALKSVCSQALGLSQPKDSESAVNPSQTAYTEQDNVSNVEHTSPELYKVPSVEEIARPSTILGDKRVKEDNDGGRSLVAEQSRKKRHGGTERNLVANYSIPKDYTVIEILPQPKYDSKKDFRPPPQDVTLPQSTPNKMYGNRMRGHQPLNTLGHSLASGSSVRNVSSGTYSSGPSNRKSMQPASAPLGQLSMVRSSGGNIARPWFFQDEDDDDMEQPRKRQKANHYTSQAMPRDMSATDEDASSNIIGMTGGRLRESAPKGAKVVAPSATIQRNADINHVFDRHEQSTVDLTQNTSTIKRRKPRCSSSGRSSKSGRTTPESAHANDLVQGTKRQPLAVDDDDAVQKHLEDKAIRTMPDESEGTAAKRPPINLMEGMENAAQQYKDQRSKQGSETDIRKANKMLDRSQQKPHETTGRRAIPQSHGIDAESFDPYRTRDIPKPAMSTTHEANLRHKFRPDNPSRTLIAGPPHSLTMTPVPRTDLGFDDELAGANTRLAHVTGSQASKKTAFDSLLDSIQSDHGREERQPSPSDLKPTNFKNLGRAAHSMPTKKVARQQKVQDNVAVRNIPLKSMLHRAFICEEGNLELAWNENLRAFSVYRGPTPVRLPGTTQPLTIRKADVSHKFEANRDTLKAFLSGSTTNHTNGKILLEFFDSDGLQGCFDYLMYASDYASSIEYVEANRMIKLYDKQREELIKSNVKLKENTFRETRVAEVRKRGFELHNGGDGLSDDIQYERYDQDRALRAPTRMQGRDTLASAIGGAGFQESESNPRAEERSSRFFEPRRSNRQSKPSKVRPRTPTPPPKWTMLNKPTQWKHPVVYPNEGLRRVTVDFSDLERLDEGEFLNDNVVNFELRYIEEHMKPEYKSKVHFFNTFFYTSLSSKAGRKMFNYDAVKRWTKNTDIFTIPYVVVPINADLHWFVAIICNLPALQRKCDAFETESSEVDKMEERSANVNDTGEPRLEADNVTFEGNTRASTEDLSPEARQHRFNTPDQDKRTAATPKKLNEHDNASDDRPSTLRTRYSKKRIVKLPKYDPSAPIIISMDSFGLARSTELKYLKQYVSEEAKAKRGIDHDSQDLSGMTAKGLPEQPNFSDCGVYLCEYIAEFARDPDEFVRRVLQREEQSDEIRNFDPSLKRGEIRDEILKVEDEQRKEREAQKRAKVVGAKQQQTVQVPGTLLATNAAPMSNAPILATHLPMDLVPPQDALSHSDKPAQHDGGKSTSSSRTRVERPINDNGDELEVEPPHALDDHPGSSSMGKLNQCTDNTSNEMLDGTDDFDTTARNTTPAEQGSGRSQKAAESEKMVPDSSEATSQPHRQNAEEPIMSVKVAKRGKGESDEEWKWEHRSSPQRHSRKTVSPPSADTVQIIDLGEERADNEEWRGLSPEIPESQDRSHIAEHDVRNLSF